MYLVESPHAMLLQVELFKPLNCLALRQLSQSWFASMEIMLLKDEQFWLKLPTR